MSEIVGPDGAPASRRRVPLTRQDVKMVTDFERWCHSMGLNLDLFCKRCAEAYGPNGRCWGNNSKDAITYHLECQCTDRVYGTSASERERPRVVADDRKIQVLVP